MFSKMVLKDQDTKKSNIIIITTMMECNKNPEGTIQSQELTVVVWCHWRGSCSKQTVDPSMKVFGKNLIEKMDCVFNMYCGEIELILLFIIMDWWTAWFFFEGRIALFGNSRINISWINKYKNILWIVGISNNYTRNNLLPAE